jgi:hypothetical protein
VIPSELMALPVSGQRGTRCQSNLSSLASTTTIT